MVVYRSGSLEEENDPLLSNKIRDILKIYHRSSLKSRQRKYNKNQWCFVFSFLKCFDTPGINPNDASHMVSIKMFSNNMQLLVYVLKEIFSKH